ncbi:MAG: threonine--tRNA ligase, partial [Methyloligellaceae bacterium]
MVSLTFPDGSTRDYEDGISGLDLAASIAKSLAKAAVAIKLDGELKDLADPIETDAAIEIVRREDAAALELIRHDAAHVMAEAVQALYPGTQVTIGPVIEDGFYYDFARDEPFHPDDLEAIEAKMREIVKGDRPFTKEVWGRDEAKAFFRDKGEHYKVELVDAIPEGEDLRIYRQGDWLDLCRGPHMTSTGKVGSAFKLLKIAGAYWRGDSNNPMLQRIYGTAWAGDKDLKAYLTRLEEAEKRDHRRLGREMDLFHFQEEAPGSVFWHAKGWALFLSLIRYMQRRQDAAGYVEVNSPDMMERSLWERSGHWEKFGENMFVTETPDERVYCCKPMNCPGHVQIFKHGLKSYRELPVKIAEFGKVHRYEPSGALHGMLRVRHFTQDDAHIFCTQEQVTEECVKVNELMLSIYQDFGFEDVVIKYADRPEKRDHRRLGREMDLYHFQEEAPGSVFWHAKGWAMFQALINYMRRRQDAAGYVEVNSPDMMDKGLWEKSGHWEKFGENMFTTVTPDERVYCCKPMNCPGHVQIFKHGLKSYRELPIKIAEFGKVHRYEPSGALHGLLRVRHFTQDDAHIFCTHEQITEECVTVNNLILSIYRDFGFEDVVIKYSDRPEKRVGSDEIWDQSEAALKTAVEAAGMNYE